MSVGASQLGVHFNDSGIVDLAWNFCVTKRTLRPRVHLIHCLATANSVRFSNLQSAWGPVNKAQSVTGNSVLLEHSRIAPWRNVVRKRTASVGGIKGWRRDFR
jgi:hypothetical protein